MRERDGVTGVDPQKIEVRKYGHNVPLAEGPCFNCGRPVRYNLAAGIAEHVGGGEPNDCRDPWPAVRPVEALTGIGVSATIQEAPQRASGDRGARVDGSGASVSLPSEPPELSVVLVRIPGGHPAGIVFRRYGPRSVAAGWRVPNIAEAVTYTWAQLHKVGEVTLLVERSAILREYADRRHYPDHSRWPMSTFGAAPTPYCACGKTWPEGGCTERRNLIADAGTAEFDRLWAELENTPEPPAVRVEWGAAHGTCEHWGSWPTEDALTTWLVDNPDWRPIQRTVSVVTPLPPVSDEMREHPGTGQPTEGVPGDDPQAAVERVRKLAEDMADWCSPYGMAPMYAERVLAALEGRPSKW